MFRVIADAGFTLCRKYTTHDIGHIATMRTRRRAALATPLILEGRAWLL